MRIVRLWAPYWVLASITSVESTFPLLAVAEGWLPHIRVGGPFHLSPKFRLRTIPSVPKVSAEKQASPKFRKCANSICPHSLKIRVEELGHFRKFGDRWNFATPQSVYYQLRTDTLASVPTNSLYMDLFLIYLTGDF